MPVLPMVGDEFAGYRLRAVVGRGGMSVVYQAENPRLGSVVALKVLAPEIATDDVFRARFLEESRIAASLNHPNVIPIYDMGPSDDLLYIAMRYVAGTDLRALLKKHAPLPPGDAIFLTGQAARALDAAHRKGLVHRDVKPGNLLIEHGQDGDPDHVYLSDFGITKYMLSRSGLTKTGEFLGTIDYVAPEQIQETPVDGRADEYSLGCVLYECLTGRVPFPKERDAAIIWAHVEEMPPPPSALQPELPAAVDDVFSRVLAKKPDDRYATCREFVDAARASLGIAATQAGTSNQTPTSNTATVLRAQHSGPSHPDVVSQRGSVPPPAAGGRTGRDEPAPGSHGRRPHKRWRWVAAVAAAVVLIGAGVGVYLGTRGNLRVEGPRQQHDHAAVDPFRASYSALDKALILANQSALVDELPAASRLPQPEHDHGHLHEPDPRDQHGDLPRLSDAGGSLHGLRGQGSVDHARPPSSPTSPTAASLPRTARSAGTTSTCICRTYSMAQSISGTLNPDSQAAGRMFCHFIASNSQEAIVWTQDQGRLLGLCPARRMRTCTTGGTASTTTSPSAVACRCYHAHASPTMSMTTPTPSDRAVPQAVPEVVLSEMRAGCQNPRTMTCSQSWRPRSQGCRDGRPGHRRSARLPAISSPVTARLSAATASAGGRIAEVQLAGGVIDLAELRRDLPRLDRVQPLNLLALELGGVRDERHRGPALRPPRLAAARPPAASALRPRRSRAAR